MPQDLNSLLDRDYQAAIINLGWKRQDKKRSLLFGLIELVPNEFPVPKIDEKEFSWRIGSEGRHYGYFKRTVTTVSRALSWYSTLSGCWASVPGPWMENPKDVEVETFALREEPKWPALITTPPDGADLPFLDDWQKSAQVHHRVATTQPLGGFTEKQRGQIFAGLEQHLLFRLSEYREWIGSVTLLCPNPFLRSVEMRLVSSDDDNDEAVRFHLKKRANVDLHRLQLATVHRRPTGVVSASVDRPSGPLHYLQAKGQVSQAGYAVLSDDYGLLEWHDPVPFVHAINIDLRVTGAHRQVEVPSGGRRHPRESYDVPMSHHDGDITVGEPPPPDRPDRIIESEQIRRREQRRARRYGQRIFDRGMRHEATTFVRGIINQARHDVLLVDPYLTTREYYRFSFATASANVNVRILTSSQVLAGSSAIDPSQQERDLLNSQLKRHHARKGVSPTEIRVMSGQRPVVHDRFLIIDGETVWLSGISLNELGNRLAVVVQLPEPESVVISIEETWRDSETLSDWIARERT